GTADGALTGQPHAAGRHAGHASRRGECDGATSESARIRGRARAARGRRVVGGTAAAAALGRIVQHHVRKLPRRGREAMTKKAKAALAEARKMPRTEKPATKKATAKKKGKAKRAPRVEAPAAEPVATA